MNDILLQANCTLGAPETTGYSWSQIRHTGFSNSSIFQLDNSQGAFAIRSWPVDVTTWDKLLFWQECNRSFEQSANPSLFPNTTPFPRLYAWRVDSNKQELLLNRNGKLWSLCQWVPGSPIALPDVSLELIEHLAVVLGTIHAYSLGFTWNSASASSQQNSASLLERFRFLSSLSTDGNRRQLPMRWLQQNGLEELVFRSMRNLMMLQNEWSRFLNSVATRQRECHWIVRDAWYSNVLINHSRFSSIVDLGASRCDWPGLDFVRLTGSLIALANARVGNNAHQWWLTAWNAYTSTHPKHNLNSLDECMLLDEISSGLSIAQWMQWIQDGRFSDADPETVNRVVQRLKELGTHFCR